MSKFNSCVHPILQICRGFHSSVVRHGRGGRYPRAPAGPVEFVENKTLPKTLPAFSINSPPIDESEEPVIELSKVEVLNEIQKRDEQFVSTQSVNEGMPPFEKLLDSDKSLGILMMRAKKSGRYEPGKLIALEGRRLIEDAFDAGLSGHSVFFSQKDTVRGIQVPEMSTTKFFKVPYSNLKIWSSLTTCPGITGIFKQPKLDELTTLQPISKDEDNLSINLICDNIRDPGNMGAILRAAAGAGCNQVILTKGCVNAWDGKVVRASTGAIFRVPIVQQMRWDDLRDLIRSEGASLFLADSREFDKDVKSYTDVTYKADGRPIVLIVGGETLGLSRQALELASSVESCAKVHIPLAHGVESLNAGVAVAVLLFEIRRQGLLKKATSPDVIVNSHTSP